MCKWKGTRFVMKCGEFKGDSELPLLRVSNLSQRILRICNLFKDWLDLYRSRSSCGFFSKLGPIFLVVPMGLLLPNKMVPACMVCLKYKFQIASAVSTSIGQTSSTFKIVSEHVSGTGFPDLSNYTLL